MVHSFDLGEVRAGSAGVQGSLWGTRAESWARVQEGLCRPLYDAGLRHIGIRPGMKHLDIGCGAGEALRLSNQMGAAVFGFDASERLIRIANQRAPEAEYRIGDMEALPYDDGAFDATTGFNSFQFAADPLRAVMEARRVTRKGGTVLVASWGRPEDCDAAGVLYAVKAFVPEPAKNSPGPFAFSPDGALNDIMATAGLEPIATDEVQCIWLYANLEIALDGLLSAGTSISALNNSGEKEVRSAVAKAIEPYERKDGSYKLRNSFRYILGRV